MTSKERVLNCIERNPIDRLPVKHEAEPVVNQALMKYFGIPTDDLVKAWGSSRSKQFKLLRRLGDDFHSVEPVYIGPELKSFKDGTQEGLWNERYKMVSYGPGEYNESIYQPFADITSPKDLDKFRWPSADWYDYSTIKEEAEKHKEYAIIAGNCGFMDLINGTAFTRGVEQVFIDIATENRVYMEIIDRRCEFFFEQTKKILDAGDGTIDIMHMGDDWGSQNGVLISPTSYRKIFMPRYKRYNDMIHSYGVKTMVHICGSVRKILPDIIETGFDIYDVVQVSSANMDLSELKEDFGDDLTFCGTVCVQTTLPKGSIEDVRKEIEFRKELFKDGGLILGPTHAIQAFTPIENILEMYRIVGSLKDNL